MHYLLFTPESSDTGPALIAELQKQGINIQGGIEIPDPPIETLIRYGSRKPIPKGFAKRVLNYASAIACAADKRRTLETLLDNGIQDVPRIWTINSLELQLPVIGRLEHHSHGTDMRFCFSKRDMQWAMTTPPGSQYFIELLPVETEWRIHIIGGKRIRTSIKYLDDPSLYKPGMRNYDTGWKFRHPEHDEKPPAKLQLAAKYAVDMLGLFFGAVDCALLEDGRICIFEVNTAPGLVTSDQGVQLYANALMKELK